MRSGFETFWLLDDFCDGFWSAGFLWEHALKVTNISQANQHRLLHNRLQKLAELFDTHESLVEGARQDPDALLQICLLLVVDPLRVVTHLVGHAGLAIHVLFDVGL